MVINKQPTIEDVKNFWENHPLFSGESKFKTGDKAFFEEHKRVVLDDCFAGAFKDELLIPINLSKDARILDLGCGIGFWTVEFLLKGYKNIYSADLAQTALEITKKRLEVYELNANLSIQNAESMTYESDFFDHVNCQGVIHHTPDIEACIREIARVLKKGGTAYISVYQKNLFLRLWPTISILRGLLYELGFKLRGRGRESILLERNPDEAVKMFDGKDNPLGKSYRRNEMVSMVGPYFEIDRIFQNFFPARALPFKIPKFLHRFLSRNFGFMIHFHLEKK